MGKYKIHLWGRHIFHRFLEDCIRKCFVTLLFLLMDGSNKCKSLRSENSNYIFRGIHLQQAKQASEFYYTYGEARRAELRMWVKRASTFYHIYVQQSPKGWAEYASEASMWVLSYIWRLARFEGPILGCDRSELLSSIIDSRYIQRGPEGQAEALLLPYLSRLL